MKSTTCIRKIVLAAAFGLFFTSHLFSQNVGIGIAAPLDRLHVAGNVRVDPLAGVGNRLVGTNANGTLIVVAAGTNGQVLTQTAAGPAWQTDTDWAVVGNAGTNPATNFAGTTDAQAFAFRTTNVERARIQATGQMVVNNTTPFAVDVFSTYAAGGNWAISAYASGSGDGGWMQNSGTGNALTAYHSGTAGAAGEFTTATANASPTVDIYNVVGTGAAVLLRTDASSGAADGMEFDINGTAAKRGIDMYMDAANSGIGIAVFQDGTGRSINIQNQNAANTNVAMFASHAGNGRIINAQNTALTTNSTQVGFFSQGSTGLAVATYQNAAAVWGQSSGIRGGVFLAAGGSTNTNCLQGSYSGAAGNFDGIGVLGTFAPNPLWGYGVVGTGNWYGVYANGDVGASGVKPFMIDHPLDPENMYLKHFSLESDEVLNMYRGTVTLDASGAATVTMPSYFHAINIDFSYNLTPIGAAAGLYIAQEMDANGNFRIAGGNPGQKVCWNVYAQRNDAYVQANPVKVQTELQKRPHEVGFYLSPELYGQPKEKGMFHRYSVDPSKVQPLNESEATPTTQRTERLSQLPKTAAANPAVKELK